MIQVEEFTINGKAFRRWYSDSGFMIERAGCYYEEAMDPAEYNRTYNETNIPIENDEATDEDYAEVGRILMGEEEE